MRTSLTCCASLLIAGCALDPGDAARIDAVGGEAAIASPSAPPSDDAHVLGSGPPHGGSGHDRGPHAEGDHDGDGEEHHDGEDETCPMADILYQTATVGTGPQENLPALIVDHTYFLGVRFTTTQPRTITGLGAHVFCGGCIAPAEAFMAVVPLDPVTNLPMTLDLSDAVGWAVGEIPLQPFATLPTTPPSTVFPTSFTLPAGTWGLVIGTARFGAVAPEVNLSLDVFPVGTPDYFRWRTTDGLDENGIVDPGQWEEMPNALNGDHVRMFVVGL